MTLDHEKTKECVDKMCDLLNEGKYTAQVTFQAMLVLFSVLTRTYVDNEKYIEFMAHTYLRTIPALYQTDALEDDVYDEYSEKIAPILEEFYQKFIAPKEKEESET